MGDLRPTPKVAAASAGAAAAVLVVWGLSLVGVTMPPEAAAALATLLALAGGWLTPDSSSPSRVRARRAYRSRP